MARKHRNPKRRPLRKVDHDSRKDFASPWGWEDESWRVGQLASQLERMAAKARVQLEEMAEKARFLADRYEVRYRGPTESSAEY
jgi:hypothetical protein